MDRCILCEPYTTIVLYKIPLSVTGDAQFTIDPQSLGRTKLPQQKLVNGRAIAVVGLDGTNISGTGPDMDEIEVQFVWDNSLKLRLFTMPERPQTFLLRFEGTTPMDIQLFGKNNATAFINVYVLIDPNKSAPCPVCGISNIPDRS